MFFPARALFYLIHLSKDKTTSLQESQQCTANVNNIFFFSHTQSFMYCLTSNWMVAVQQSIMPYAKFLLTIDGKALKHWEMVLENYQLMKSFSKRKLNLSIIYLLTITQLCVNSLWLSLICISILWTDWLLLFIHTVLVCNVCVCRSLLTNKKTSKTCRQQTGDNYKIYFCGAEATYS